ncbi:RraA family protein [Streptomyces sp. LE64]|uniref:RraA family protein n=1 Tax=Streptomyces sp. LE64 TaxID=3448653 RepID=UPI004042C480
MPLDIRALPAPADAALLAKLRRVDFPTLGHYLEEGFCAPGLQRMAGTERLVGRAVTVRTTATDSTLLHHAAGLVEPGDVVVVDCGGDRRHAPLGEVVANALASRRAAGVVVDGLCTDVDALRALDLPVYAYGRTPLTTKLHGLADGSLCAPVVCGGVPVHPGDLVLGDANGVIVAPAERLAAVIDQALADDAEEPALVARLWQGEPLGSLTGATETLQRLS